LEMFTAKLNRINSADLVILPEMFATGFSMHTELAEDAVSGPSVTWMKEMASARHMAVCGSLMVKDDGEFYNRFYFVTPECEMYTYNKRHLFTLAREQDYYTAGSEQLVIDYKGWKIAPQVCYD